MADTELIRQHSGGQVSVRQDLSGDQYTVSGELAPTAGAAAAKAHVEALIVAANRWPRNEDLIRLKILADCSRPAFAEIALYSKPVGKKKNPETGKYEQSYAVDFSVRFVESALRRWGRYSTEYSIASETATQIQVKVLTMDLENLIVLERDRLIEKIVERREQRGGPPLGMRRNTFGDEVFLYPATREETDNMVASARAKLYRDTGKLLLPRDLLEECRVAIDKTNNNSAAVDPAETRKKMFDNFYALGVTPLMLSDYMGRSLDNPSPQELAHLRMIYAGLKEGETTWAEVVKAKAGPEEAPEPRKKNALLEKVLSQAGIEAEVKP